jgi:Ni/Fe-hydrogenase subunit HybB-like protein
MTNVTAFFRRHPFWLWIVLLLPIIGAGVVAGLMVFTQGLAVTNLTDLAPWGLWIVTDLSFIGLAAGAFSISALTHLAGLKALQPLARMAVFIGVLGYYG